MQLMGTLAVVLLLALAGCQVPAPVADPEPPLVAAPEPEPVLPAPVRTTARADAERHGERTRSHRRRGPVRCRQFQWRDQTFAGRQGDLGRLDNRRRPLQQAGRPQISCIQLLRDEPSHAMQEALRRRLKLDADFNLEPTEKTHPVWGPEFERAKKQASAPAAPAKSPASSAAAPSNKSKAQ